MAQAVKAKWIRQADSYRRTLALGLELVVNYDGISSFQKENRYKAYVFRGFLGNYATAKEAMFAADEAAKDRLMDAVEAL